MFEFDKESQALGCRPTTPFTSPHEEDMERLVSDPASVRARYYDLAMNGLELGLRLHSHPPPGCAAGDISCPGHEPKEEAAVALRILP